MAAVMEHVYEFLAPKSKSKGVTGCIVAIVTCYVKKMTKSSSASIGHSFGTNFEGK